MQYYDEKLKEGMVGDSENKVGIASVALLDDIQYYEELKRVKVCNTGKGWPIWGEIIGASLLRYKYGDIVKDRGDDKISTFLTT